jgi:uncharacterized protein (DUF1330 family)
MAKGYWVANIDVTDMDGYKAYVAANAKPLHKFGAKFLTRGGKSESVEGKLRSRVVVIEFPNYQAALDCYHSPEYQEAKALRIGRGVGEIVVIEGYDGPQP